MQEKNIKQWLERQTMIRLLIVHTPNYGDQYSAIKILEKIVQLGFSGITEIIYENNDTKKKIIKLLELPSDTMHEYADEKFKLRFVLLENFLIQRNKGEIKLMDFGFIGGVPGPFSVRDEEIVIENNTTFITMQTNLADLFNTKRFINFFTGSTFKVSPEKVRLNKFIDTKIWSINNSVVETHHQSGDFAYQHSYANIPEAIAYLLKDERGKLLSEKNPALLKLLRGLYREKIDTFPLYGIGINENAGNMEKFLLAARNIKVTLPEFSNRALVVPVFWRPENQIFTEINRVFTGNLLQSDYETNPAFFNMISKLAFNSDNFKAIYLNDSDAIDVISQLKPEQIVVIFIDYLPKIIFEAIFTHAKTAYPIVIEGHNSINMAAIAKKPFIYCGYHSDIVIWYYLKALNHSLGHIQYDLCAKTADETGIASISDIIVLYQNTSSSLYQKTMSVYHSFEKTEDRVVAALKKIIKEDGYEDVFELKQVLLNSIACGFTFQMLDNSLKNLTKYFNASSQKAEVTTELMKFLIFLYMGAYTTAGLSGITSLCRLTGYVPPVSFLNYLPKDLLLIAGVTVNEISPKTIPSLVVGAVGAQLGKTVADFTFWGMNKVSGFLINKTEQTSAPQKKNL